MTARSRHILVGYGGTESGRRALAAAADLAGYGSAISVLPVAAGNGAGDSAALLGEAREALLGRHVLARYLDPVGDTADRLVKAAGDLRADLVVVGRAGRLQSGEVGRSAACDVLIVS